MNRKSLFGFMMLFVLIFSAHGMAQSDSWRVGETRDGKITCKYKISVRNNEKGVEVPLIESTTTTVEEISLEKCISLTKNISQHKYFHDDEKSYLIKTISNDEWVLYYFTDKTLFTPESDGVYSMTLAEDTSKGMVEFTIKADPELFEDKGVNRVTYMEERIKLKELDQGKVQITISSKVSPAFKVPQWIMKMAFPNICLEVMENFVKLAHAQ